MKVRSSVIVFIVMAICMSCSFNGTLQGLFGYYNKTKEENVVHFVRYENIQNCFSLVGDSATVIVANGTELKHCLSEYENALVYRWSPKCRSQYCYSLNLLEERCKQEGVELFIVASYYDTYHMSVSYDLTHSLIGIDTEYYRTNLTSKYQERFFKDLMENQSKFDAEEHEYYKFFSFKNGEFERAFMSIDDI